MCALEDSSLKESGAQSTEKQVSNTPTTAPASKDAPISYEQFILLGDSITQLAVHDFAPALQEAYIRRLDIVNRGFSGYTTDGALRVLPQFMPKPHQAKVRMMTIFFGANDACLQGFPWSEHVPIERFRDNIKQMVNHPTVQSHSPIDIILITPPPIDEHQLWYQDRLNSEARKYAAAVIQVGQELGLPSVDLWTACMKEAGWKEDSKEPLPGSKAAKKNPVLAKLLFDGLHLSSLGYKILFDETMKVIETQLPHQMPESIPWVYLP